MTRRSRFVVPVVLVLLSTLVASGVPHSGDTGLMLALGPGFAAEMLAIVW